MSNDNSITRFINIPDYLSLANGALGLLAIISSINKEMEWAMLFILLAGLMDFFDGRIARKRGITSEFGKQLDSLCDLCSFVIAPIVFLYSIESITIYVRISAAIIYLLTGILRLARFNITGTIINNGKYFEGMPVPFSIVIVTGYFLFQFLSLPFIVWTLFYFIHAALMISTVKIRKL